MTTVATVVVVATEPEVMVVVLNRMGSKTTTMLVGVELIVMGTVEVNRELPEVTVVVPKPAGTGVSTTIMLVGVPLIVVGTVDVNPTLPDVTVVVWRGIAVGTFTMTMLVVMPLTRNGNVEV